MHGGRAQYRSSRSSPARSCAPTRTAASCESAVLPGEHLDQPAASKPSQHPDACLLGDGGDGVRCQCRRRSEAHLFGVTGGRLEGLVDDAQQDMEHCADGVRLAFEVLPQALGHGEDPLAHRQWRKHDRVGDEFHDLEASPQRLKTLFSAVGFLESVSALLVVERDGAHVDHRIVDVHEEEVSPQRRQAESFEGRFSMISTRFPSGSNT